MIDYFQFYIFYTILELHLECTVIVPSYIVAYLRRARTVEPQRPRGTRATGELRIESARC
jgi:hypothetical protein